MWSVLAVVCLNGLTLGGNRNMKTSAWASFAEHHLRKTHAQQLIHSTVEQQCGRSKDTLRFMDMRLFCRGRILERDLRRGLLTCRLSFHRVSSVAANMGCLILIWIVDYIVDNVKTRLVTDRYGYSAENKSNRKLMFLMAIINYYVFHHPIEINVVRSVGLSSGQLSVLQLKVNKWLL